MFSLELDKRNDALKDNPNRFYYPAASDINITDRGSDWYWTVASVMGFSAIVFIALSTRVHRTRRLFYYINAAITLTAAITYYTMASNLGYAAIGVEFHRSDSRVSGTYREIFYVRYIGRVITTALIILEVLLTAGLPWPTILYTIFMDEVWVITSLVGALVVSRYKWGYFAFGCAAIFFIAYNLLFVGRKHAFALGREINRAYSITAVWTTLLLFIYPIAWGVSEGGNVIAPDSESIFYGILDLLAMPVFGALLLWAHRNIDPASLGLHIRDYDTAPHRYGLEKPTHDGPVTSGVTDPSVPVPAGAHTANNTV